MSENLNLEELIEDLDLDEVIFTQRTERSDNGVVVCSLQDVIHIVPIFWLIVFL